MFGCGLRQFECLQLRVRDFNFEADMAANQKNLPEYSSTISAAAPHCCQTVEQFGVVQRYFPLIHETVFADDFKPHA